MTNKSIQETEAAYGERATALLGEWYAAKDEISRSSVRVEGPHADLLTPAGRAQAVYKQKAEKAREKTEDYRREYLELTEERNDAVRSRTRYLHKAIFAVENEDVLSRVALATDALATDAQLGAMMELAATTGSAELGRTVFVVSEQRQLGEIVNRYLTTVAPEAGEAHEELRTAPSEEALERRHSDADRLIAAPDASDFAPTLGMV